MTLCPCTTESVPVSDSSYTHYPSLEAFHFLNALLYHLCARASSNWTSSRAQLLASRNTWTYAPESVFSAFGGYSLGYLDCLFGNCPSFTLAAFSVPTRNDKCSNFSTFAKADFWIQPPQKLWNGRYLTVDLIWISIKRPNSFHLFLSHLHIFLGKITIQIT